MIYVQDNNPVSKSERANARFAILILQIITVAVLLTFAAGIRIFGGDIYDKLSYLYHEKFDDVTLASDVLEPNKSKENSSEDTSEISGEAADEQPKADDEKGKVHTSGRPRPCAHHAARPGMPSRRSPRAFCPCTSG